MTLQTRDQGLDVTEALQYETSVQKVPETLKLIRTAERSAVVKPQHLDAPCWLAAAVQLIKRTATLKRTHLLICLWSVGGLSASGLLGVWSCGGDGGSLSAPDPSEYGMPL